MTNYRIMPNPFPGFQNIKPQTVVSQKPTRGIKAGTNGALIAVVLDESGSMNTCKSDTIGGFNNYIDQQKENDQKTSVTLCKFEGGRLRYPYKNLDINQVPHLNHNTFTPMGSTNLLDAIGETIVSTDEYLKGLKKKDRPAVIVVIMTDGEENSSRNYNNELIKQMVNEREEKEWVFLFLGANIDAFSVGSQFGMKMANTASYSTGSMAETMAVVSDATTRIRTAKMAGVSTNELYTSSLYTDEERNNIK